MVRYGYHGYGNPADSLGVVILDEQGFDTLQGLEPVKSIFARTASPELHALADRFGRAAARA